MAKGKYREWITDEGLLKLQGWARDGLTDEQIAYNIGIRRETLYQWENRFPNISNALKKGKEVVDRQVESSLYKRANGYMTTDHQYKVVDIDDNVLWAKRKRAENQYKIDHPEATEEEIKIYGIEHVKTRERIEIFQNEREVPPDTTAIIFWLKNRKPEAWRDKQDVNLGGDVNIRRSMKNLTDDELRRLSHEPESD